MSRICIIGGAGFIGSYLHRLLKKDHTLFVLDKKELASGDNDINYICADIRNKEELAQKFPADIDSVVLLAAEHKDDVQPVSLYYDVNAQGTSNVLSVMEEKKVNKIIFTSSVAVYGLNKAKPDESSPVDPFNHYGKSKLKAEEILRKWFELHSDKKSLIIIRPTVTFGPGNRGNVYNLLSQISSGKFVMIGSGRNKKSMAYVENVAGFIKHCINNELKGYHLYNYVDKPDLSTKELVSEAEKAIGKKILPVKVPYIVGYAGARFLDIISVITKKKFSVTAVRVKKFCATTQFDSITIQATGFIPPVPLEDALKITIKDILNNEKNV